MLTYLKSERGSSAAEYALILAVLGGAVALSVTALKTALGANIAAAAAQTASLDAGVSPPPAPPVPDPTPTDPKPCKGKGCNK